MTIVISYIFLHKSVDWRHLWGLAFILLGLGLVLWTKWQEAVAGQARPPTGDTDPLLYPGKHFIDTDLDPSMVNLDLDSWIDTHILTDDDIHHVVCRHPMPIEEGAPEGRVPLEAAMETDMNPLLQHGLSTSEGQHDAVHSPRPSRHPPLSVLPPVDDKPPAPLGEYQPDTPHTRKEHTRLEVEEEEDSY